MLVVVDDKDWRMLRPPVRVKKVSIKTLLKTGVNDKVTSCYMEVKNNG